jgi:hypothetical protein
VKASPSLDLTFGYPLISTNNLFLFGFNHCILLWESYRYFKVGERIKFHRLKFCRLFSFPSCVLQAPHVSSFLFDHPNNICWKVGLRLPGLLFILFSPFSVHSSLLALKSKYLLNTPHSDTEYKPMFFKINFHVRTKQ